MAKHIHVHLGKAKAKDATNHLGEKEYYTFRRWKEAVKAAYPNARFEGDEDMCNAVPGGDWDGEKGVVYAKKTGDADSKEELLRRAKKLEEDAWRLHKEGMVIVKEKDEAYAAFQKAAVREQSEGRPKLNKAVGMFAEARNLKDAAALAQYDKKTGDVYKELEAVKKETTSDANYSDEVRRQLQAINQDLTEAARKMERLQAAWSGSDAGLDALDKLINDARRKCFELR